MATPGQLVQVTADVLGISKATVTQYDRALAENGLRSKSGRGKSAAKVTSRDAANLLMALAASPLFGMSAKDAVRNCEAYASLRSSAFAKQLKYSENFARFGLSTLANLPEEHRFGEALSALIDAAGKDEVFKQPESDRKLISVNLSFEIQFVGPRPSAQILADGTKDFGLLARLIYVGERTSKRSRKARSRMFEGDLRQISSIGFATIRALGSLVSGDGAA